MTPTSRHVLKLDPVMIRRDFQDSRTGAPLKAFSRSHQAITIVPEARGDQGPEPEIIAVKREALVILPINGLRTRQWSLLWRQPTLDFAPRAPVPVEAPLDTQLARLRLD